MRNPEVIALLNTIADVLEIRGDEELFKILAYRRAARSIEDLPEDIEDLRKQGRLNQIPGVGEAIREKITEFLTTGKLEYLEKITKGFPPGLLEMLRVPRLGPKKVQALWRELGVTSVEALKKACEQRRVRRLKGFGERTEELILQGIRLLGEGQEKRLISNVWDTVEAVRKHLEEDPAVERVAVAGSVRRMKEVVGDVDFLVLSKKPAQAAAAFTKNPLVEEVVMAGDTKCTVFLRTPAGRFQADLRILEARSWGAGLQYFTGSKDHNIALRTLALEKGLKLSEYGLFRGEDPVAGETEEGVYEALGLRWIPPELREAAGEIEAARSGSIPDLVTLEDVRGDFHAHTNLSDGVHTLPQMAAAAKALGYEYLGLSEHSQSLAVARGLSPEEVRLRKAEARGFNAKAKGLRLLLGTECDIRKDGSLDYEDGLLKEFDYVVASVHSHFNLPRNEQTARVIAAVEHPEVNVLAHPTTRKFGERDPLDIDLERVFEAAAAAGTAVEVNSGGNRMDLTGPQANLARELGCAIATDTDAHSTAELGTMRFAVGLARRGWCTAKDVVNAWPLEKVLAFFA